MLDLPCCEESARRRRQWMVAAIAFLFVSFCINALSTTNRMQGDRIGLALSRFTSEPLDLAPPGAIRGAPEYDYFDVAVREQDGVFSASIPGFGAVRLDDQLRRVLRSTD